jgi:hypothetical protein
MNIENTDASFLLSGRATIYMGKIYRLEKTFTKHHTLGADEQNYTDTAAYAEQFIQQVVRLRNKG